LSALLFNGHYYYIVTGGTSYETAASAAVSSFFNGLQAHLVTVTSQEESDFLKTTFGNYSFWIAASDTQSESTWIWTQGPESGLVINPTFWQSSQPNGGTGSNCAAMSTAGWDDQSCTSFLSAYVVEYEN
jgi:hypothetical protein